MRLVRAASIGVGLALALLAIATYEPAPTVVIEDQPGEPKPRAGVHEISDNLGAECVPFGHEGYMIGTLVIQDSKGPNKLVMLETEGDGTWLLSYDADSLFYGLEGKQVRARGRECEEYRHPAGGQALGGRRIALVSITEL